MGGRMGNLNAYLISEEDRTSKYSTLGKNNEGFEFVIKNENTPTSAPIFSNTSNNTYVTINKTGNIDSITVYKNHKEQYTIHPSKHGEHGGLHVHSARGKSRSLIATTNEHRTLYNKVRKSYTKQNISSKATIFRRQHEK